VAYEAPGGSGAAGQEVNGEMKMMKCWEDFFGNKLHPNLGYKAAPKYS